MNIIALDDEPSALKVLERAISRSQSDADVECFTDTQNALDYFKDHGADAVFLDIQMPGITGVQAAEMFEELDPQVNLIFTTGYADYAIDAFKLHASGYLMKPIAASEVAEELAHLRNPITSARKEPAVKVQTFGNFEVFSQGVPVPFARRRAKELFAFLVDRRGATVSKREAAAVLFGDEYSPRVQNYMSKIYKDMVTSLEGAGAANAVIKSYNSYAANPNAFSCDLYRYLDGDPLAKSAYCGEYMRQYEWAEGRFLG